MIGQEEEKVLGEERKRGFGSGREEKQKDLGEGERSRKHLAWRYCEL